jgi:hypothetical protein
MLTVVLTLSSSGVVAIRATAVGTCMVGRKLKDLLLDLKMPEMPQHLNYGGTSELLL